MRFLGLILCLLPMLAAAQFPPEFWHKPPSSSLTAPTVVRMATNSADSASSLTMASFNSSGGNYLIVGVVQRSSIARSISSITFAGSQNLASILQTNYFDASHGIIALWGLANPTGTGDIVVTLNNTAGIGFAVGAILLNNVGSVATGNGLAAKEETALKTTISITPTTVATDLVVDCLAYTNSVTVATSGGQTVQINKTLTPIEASMFMSTIAGAAGSTTVSYSASGGGTTLSLIAATLHGQ